MSERTWTLVAIVKGEGRMKVETLLESVPATTGHLSITSIVIGTIVVLLFLAGAGSAAGKGKKRERRDWEDYWHSRGRGRGRRSHGRRDSEDRALADEVLEAVFGALGRFLVGKEISGKPASNATAFKAGRRPLSHTLRFMPQPAATESVGLAELTARREQLALPAGPSAAAKEWKDWSETWAPRALRGVVRHAGAALVWFGAVLAGSAHGVGSIGRGLRTWGTWPYACRAMARMTVVFVIVGLCFERTRVVTAWSAGGVVLAVLAVAATGPAGLGWWRGVAYGDDRIYGPALWAVVRPVLKQDEEEYLEYWLAIPEDVRAEGAQIHLRLPVEFPATDVERAQLDYLVNSRLPGEWVSRAHTMAGNHSVTWTRKPKPKPAPKPPEHVSFFDTRIQEAIRSCPLGYIVLGIDERDRIVIRRLDGETAHWVASIGSGGGKSSLLQFIIVQLVIQFATVVGIDPKEVSIKCFIGVPGIYIYNDPRNVQDMQGAVSWVKEELDARNYVAARKEIVFPKLVLVIDETNELANLSKSHHDDTKEKGELASDPMWKHIGSFMRLGRQNGGNLVAVFQELRDDILGGRGVKGLFRLFLMGSFFPADWKRVMGTGAAPECEFKAGRVLLVDGSEHTWLQVPIATEAEYRQFAIAEREAQGWTPERAGLFGAPPERSPERLPKLLRGTSHVTDAETAKRAPGASLGGKTADDVVTQGRRDATRDGLSPAPRDDAWQGAGNPQGRPLSGVERLLLEARRSASERAQEAGHDAATSWRTDATDNASQGTEAAQDAVPAELLFTLAEISRRLEARKVIITDARMRQAKARDKKSGKNRFPKGTEVATGNGNTVTKYTESEIVAFFSPATMEEDSME